MEKANLNGVTLQYEVTGAGEDMLFIGGAHIADAFLPLRFEAALADRYRLIRYQKRGLAGSTHDAAPVSIADHAADAVRLMDYLGIERAHVVGHSSGGTVGLQMLLDSPERVHTLIGLEPVLLSVPSAEAFFVKAGPSVQAYAAGDRAAAVALFLGAVSGLDWDSCRATIDQHVPGGVAQAIEDADTFFRIELPALQAWTITAGQAAAIARPVQMVVGGRTEPLFVEAADRLGRWLPRVERCTIDGAGHLLQMQNPAAVARGIAQFCRKHPMLDVLGSMQRTAAVHKSA